MRLSRGLVFSTCMGATLLVAMCDYLTGVNLSLALFYLVPVCALSWAAGRGAGISISVLACGCSLLGARMGTEVFPYWNAASRFLIFVAAVFVITFLQGSLSRERHLARSDPLTSVANRRAFYEVATHEVSRYRRYARPFTLAHIDVDDFKFVNDEHGHTVGDSLLRALAGALERSTRQTDVIARLGGDEFVVLLPETAEDRALAALEKIQKELTLSMRDLGYPTTVSIGAATFMRAPASTDEIVAAADSCMYAAKGSGKNRIHHVVVRDGDAASRAFANPSVRISPWGDWEGEKVVRTGREGAASRR